MGELFDPAEFKHQVAEYVTEQVVLSFTTRPAGVIASITNEAYQASLRGEQFSDALGKALSALVVDPFKQAVEQLIEKAEE